MVIFLPCINKCLYCKNNIYYKSCQCDNCNGYYHVKCFMDKISISSNNQCVHCGNNISIEEQCRIYDSLESICSYMPIILFTCFIIMICLYILIAFFL